MGGMGFARTPPPFKALRGGKECVSERREELRGRRPLPFILLMGWEGSSSSPTGSPLVGRPFSVAPSRCWRPDPPPAHLFVFDADQSQRRAAPSLPSRKHWALVSQQVAAGLGSRAACASLPVSLPAPSPWGDHPGPGAWEGPDWGCRQLWALSLPGSQSDPRIPSSLASSFSWGSRLLLWPPLVPALRFPFLPPSHRVASPFIL